MQILLCLMIYMMIFVTNPFYMLLYFFTYTFTIGCVILIYQIEFFTGFLYVLEITVVFIMLILYFYFNFKGTWSYNLSEYITTWPVFFFIIYSLPTVYVEDESTLPNLFNAIDTWDDYYEALNQHLMNDFAGLFISYYMVHSLELIIIGFMLFIGSIGCITLYSLINTSKRVDYNLVINFLSYYTKFYDTLFIRKQTLNNQTHRRDSVRVVKKTIDGPSHEKIKD